MKKFGLLGEKLSHSWSPIIHKYIFEELNIEANYELLECKEDDLGYYIELLKSGTYDGYNVTIPYKKTIMKYLDYIDSAAENIGSVNTITMIDGKIWGYNTDYQGFIMELDFYDIDVKNKNVFILGTGGAAVAIYKALLDKGANPVFVSRKPDESMIGYDELENQKIDILVNATPVGMYPNIDESPVNIEVVKKASVVIDLIFNPLKTKLLGYAESDYHGLYMLIGQAIEAEKIWNQKDIKIDMKIILDKIIEVKSL